MKKIRIGLLATAILSGATLLGVNNAQANNSKNFVIKSHASPPISEKDVSDKDIETVRSTALSEADHLNLKEKKDSVLEQIQKAWTSAEIKKAFSDAESISGENNKLDEEQKKKEEEERAEQEAKKKAKEEKASKKNKEADSQSVATSEKDYSSALSDPGAAGLRPQAAKFRAEIMDVFGITDIGGFRAGDDDGVGTGHGQGLAIDVMVPVSSELGDKVANYTIKNLQARGVSYIIWKQRFWSPVNNIYGPANTWNPMPDRGGTTANHYDHVHISFKP